MSHRMVRAAVPDPGRAVALPASASLAVRDVLVGRDVEVVVSAAFPMATYLTVDAARAGRTIAVVTADGIAHPNALVLAVGSDQRPLAGSHAGQRGVVGGGRLLVAGRSIAPRRWWDPVPRLRATSSGRLRSTAATIDGSLPLASHLPRDVRGSLVGLAEAVGVADTRAASAHAFRLLGRGPGLTPSGDDAIAGLLAGVHRLGPALGLGPVDPVLATAATVGGTVASAAIARTTSVSAALLDHAARGEVAAPVAALLRAVVGRTDVADATAGLLAVGSSSGGDLLAGLLAAMVVVADAADAADAAADDVSAVADPPASRLSSASPISPTSPTSLIAPRPLHAGAA